MPNVPQSNSLDLAGQRAVVTGASSGIGRSIALELARGGADVLLHARRSEKALQDVAEQIRRLGRTAETQLADLSDTAAQDEVIDWAWGIGPVDIWINNAGVDVLTGDAAAWSFEQKLSALWAVDVTATMRLSRRIGTLMFQRRSGVILNIGWDQSSIGMAGDSGEMFAAIKAAVAAFSLSLAKTLAPHVRVNCLAPGWIKTAWGEGASEAWQARAKSESLLDRWGTPEDVARVARFLASPAAAFVNGQIVAVNGGWGGE